MLEDDDRQDSRIAALERILAVPAVKAARPLSIVLALMGAFAIVPHVQLPPELYAISVNVGVEMLGSLIDRIAHRDLTDEEILDRIQELIDELDLLPTSDYFDPRFELLRSGQRRLSKQNQALEKVIRVEAKETRRQVYEVFEALFPNYVSTDEMPTAEKMVERVEEDFLDEIETHQLFDRELQTKLSNVAVFALADEEAISVEVQRAERLIAGGDHAQAADIFDGLSSRLAQNKQPVQARKYAKRASKEYLAAENKQAAAEQLILAAETWLAQTTYEPLLARRDLEEAGELAVDVQNYTLQARSVLLQANLFLITGDPDKSESLWQEAGGLLLKVSDESQVELYCELALQRAMCARLDEDYEGALQILKEADRRDWSAKSQPKRLELLWVLLFLQAEIGDWDTVDQTYGRAQEVLQIQRNPIQCGAWLMHYAGTLARRGAQNDAYQAYMEALDGLEKARADVYQKHHLYQDMCHMLLRYADFEVSAPILNYDSRRLDLALNVLHETISAQHVQRAEQHFLQGDLDSATNWGRAALILAWRDGSWSSANRAYQALTRLYAGSDQPLEATFAAIHAADHKNVREYADRAANTTDIVQIKRLLDGLLHSWPTAVEQRHALMALAGCADVIPPEQLDEVTDQALEVLSRFSQVSSGREASRRAAELLRELAPRFSSGHTDRVVRVCVDELNRSQFIIMQQELVRILGACFANKHQVDPGLYEPVLEAILSLTDKDAVRQDAEFAVTELAVNASDAIRERIVDYLQRESNWSYLAAIGEPVPQNEVRAAIEEILVGITPRREEGRISLTGWRAQSITNFNEVLPSSLYDFVVDGLLEAATNSDSFAGQRAGAIRTLRWLPEDAISERADRIAAVLLDICDDDDNESESDRGVWSFLGGPSNQVVQSSLYTLGHLYEWSSADTRERILERIISSSDHNDVLVRTGAAMALRRTRGSDTLPFQIVMAHERLLSDREPVVRRWAGATTGHLVMQPLLQEPNANYFIGRLAELALTEEDAFARSGMAYGLRVIADNQEDSLPESVSYALERLANDVSYQVRHQAKSEREEG